MAERIQILAIGCLSVLIALAMYLIPEQVNLIWMMVVGWFALLGIEVAAVSIARVHTLEQKITRLEKEKKE